MNVVRDLTPYAALVFGLLVALATPQATSDAALESAFKESGRLMTFERQNGQRRKY